MYTSELKAIQALLPWHNDFLDSVFLFMRHLDSAIFMIVLVPLVWLVINPRWGMRLLYAAMFSALVNYLLKQAFGWPRPCDLDPSLAMISIGKSFGFPSGGAQTALLIPGLLIAGYRTRLAWIAGILFWFLLSASRIYLGVHFFTDLIGGWLAGGILLAVYLRLGPGLEKLILSWPNYRRILYAVGLPLIAILLFPNPRTFGVAGAMIGTGLGVCFSPISHQRFLECPRWLRFIAAAIVLWVMFILVDAAPQHLAPWGVSSSLSAMLTNFSLGFWQLLGSLALIYLLYLRKNPASKSS